MPATSKGELLALTHREFGKLSDLIADITEADAQQRDDADTSIKDVIAHRAHWIGLFQGWYHDGRAGKEVHFPAEGYKWNELVRYNAELRASQRGLGWHDARSSLHDAHRALVGLIESLTDDELYGAPMAGANNHWTTGRWAEAAGPSHYRSAAKYVRSRQRAMRRA